MDTYNFMFAVLAFLAFVAIVPAWVWFVFNHPNASALAPEGRFIALMVLPATVTMFILSWMGGS